MHSFSTLYVQQATSKFVVNYYNADKPCTIKTNIYIGKNYKKLHIILVSGSDICLWQGQKVSENDKGGGDKKTWVLNAYRSSFVYCSNRLLHSYFPPLCWADWTSLEMLEKMSAVSWELLTVPQEVDLSPSSRKVPWWGLLPTTRKAFLILLVCTKTLQIHRAPTDFFTLA